jgi:hypothetical protein
VDRQRQELELIVDEVSYTSTVTGTYTELNTGARQIFTRLTITKKILFLLATTYQFFQRYVS